MSFVEFDQQIRRSLIEGSQIAAGAIHPHHFSSEAVREYSLADGSVSSRTVASSLQSDNYVAGVSGWRIDRVTGDVEFGSGDFRGSVIVASLDIPDTTTASSFHVDTTGRMWIGANASNFATAPFRVTAAGAVTATSVTLSNPTVTTGSFSSPAISSGTVDGATFRVPGNSYPRAELTNSTVYSSGYGLRLPGGSGDADVAFLGGQTNAVKLSSGRVTGGDQLAEVQLTDLSGASITADDGTTQSTLTINASPQMIWQTVSPSGSVDFTELAVGWTSFAPTLTQSGTVTATTARGAYIQVGSLVIFQFRLSVTGSGTAGNDITVSLPVSAAYSPGAGGAGGIYDASVPTFYIGHWETVSSSTIAHYNDASNGNPTGTSPSFALASGDVIAGFYIYEAA